MRWKGFSHEDDTWEPLEHLSGCEQYIARFEEERDRKQAEDDDARGQKRKSAMMTRRQVTCINIDAWLIRKTVISSVARICQCRRQAVCNLHVEDDERHSVWDCFGKGWWDTQHA